MPVLNRNRYLALHDRRIRNLITTEETIEEVRMEETPDTKSPYYKMIIKGSDSQFIFPVDGETRKIGNLTKGNKLIFKRSKTNPFVIIEITDKNGEIIYSPKDSIDQYVV